MNMNSATGFPEKRQRLEAFNLVASGGLTDSEKRIIKFEKALETIRAEESHIKDFVKSTKWFDLNGEEFLQLHYSDPCAKIFEGFAIRAGGSRVVEISLGHRSLTGTIPSSIGMFTHLFLLHLESNDLKGEIPETLGRLTNLISLNLSDNQLSGHLHLSVLRLLSVLKCKAARDRRLGIEVNLHHAGPGFILPGNIEDLGGAFNELDLSSCNLTGGIPASISRLTNLSKLHLGGNPRMTGELSLPMVGLLSRMNQSKEAHLKLGGDHTLPANIDDLDPAITVLDLRHCGLTGSIPESLSKLTALQKLYLSFNKLSGEIPASLAELINLTSLCLGNNMLSGKIPATLGELSNLTHLSLHHNNLSGEIPGSINQLLNLTELWLATMYDDNKFSGGYEYIANLSQLQTLRLDGFWDKFEDLPTAIAYRGFDFQVKLEYLRDRLEAFADPLV